jgi:hypothetical protein
MDQAHVCLSRCFFFFDVQPNRFAARFCLLIFQSIFFYRFAIAIMLSVRFLVSLPVTFLFGFYVLVLFSFVVGFPVLLYASV